jgi:hypothetical protein
MKFVPQKGMYFYSTVTPKTQEVFDDHSGDVKTIVQVDGSYRGDIFYCMGADDTCVVAERVYGGGTYEPYMFHRSSFSFEPVGPEVMAVVRGMFKHKFARPEAEVDN